MAGPINLKIADIVYSLQGEFPPENVSEVYRRFVCEDRGEISLRIFQGIPPFTLKESELVYQSGTTWTLHHSKGRWVFTLRFPEEGESPQLLATFEPDFRKGEVYIRSPVPSRESLLNPLGYPLGQVLTVCLLSLGQGVMFHACGVDDRGSGLLFLGNSSEGKSTMAQLWEEESTVLNDDRIVVREKLGRFWMYGTPWHGSHTEVSPYGVPIDKVFFLQHGRQNSAMPKQGGEAVSMMLRRSFPPVWDKAGMDYTVDLCQRMAEATPCYQLDFVPNPSIVNFTRNL